MYLMSFHFIVTYNINAKARWVSKWALSQVLSGLMAFCYDSIMLMALGLFQVPYDWDWECVHVCGRKNTSSLRIVEACLRLLHSSQKHGFPLSVKEDIVIPLTACQSHWDGAVSSSEVLVRLGTGRRSVFISYRSNKDVYQTNPVTT